MHIDFDILKYIKKNLSSDISKFRRKSKGQ